MRWTLFQVLHGIRCCRGRWSHTRSTSSTWGVQPKMIETEENALMVDLDRSVKVWCVIHCFPLHFYTFPNNILCLFSRGETLAVQFEPLPDFILDGAFPKDKKKREVINLNRMMAVVWYDWSFQSKYFSRWRAGPVLLARRRQNCALFASDIERVRALRFCFDSLDRQFLFEDFDSVRGLWDSFRLSQLSKRSGAMINQGYLTQMRRETMQNSDYETDIQLTNWILD